MAINISGWFGFWIFIIFFLALDAYIFTRGYNSYLHTHKTPEEKELQHWRISQARIDYEVKELLLKAEKSKPRKQTAPPRAEE